MNVILLICLVLPFLCECSKRHRPKHTATKPKAKRVKTANPALSQAVARGDIDAFWRTIASDENFLLDVDQAAGLIQVAVDNGHAKLLQRMMTIGPFREALNYAHLNYVICYGTPDILEEILSVWPIPDMPTEKDENEISKLQQASLSTCPLKIKLLASVFQPCWEMIEDGCSKRHPSTLQFVLQQHLASCSSKFDMLEMDLELLWLAGLHCPNSFMSSLFFQWMWTNDPEVHKQRPPVFLVMEDILRALDEGTPEHLTKIFASIDTDEVDPMQVRIMTIESIIKRKHYKLLDIFPMDGYTANFISYKRFYTMFCSALRDNKVAELNTLLVKFSPSLQLATLRHSMLEIFDDWVLEGDLHSMNLASKYLRPLLTSRQRGFLNLAEQVFSGNWRYLMVFMEMNPNRIIVSNVAWKIILCERPSDSIINMIVSSQLNNQ